MDLKESAKEFISSAQASGNVPDRHAGASLAVALRSRAIDMSYSKATDCSPEIPELLLLAAQVAFMTFGPSSPDLEEYESDVSYYARIKPPGSIPVLYEAFKAQWLARVAVD